MENKLAGVDTTTTTRCQGLPPCPSIKGLRPMLLVQAVAIVTLRSQVIGLLLVSVLCLLSWVLGFGLLAACFNCCHCLNVALR